MSTCVHLLVFKDLPNARWIASPLPQTTPRTVFGDISLKQVLAMIEADEALSASKKTEWRCALRRLARYLDKDLPLLPARLGALRHGVGQLHHARLGISKKSLQNLSASIKGTSKNAFPRSQSGRIRAT